MFAIGAIMACTSVAALAVRPRAWSSALVAVASASVVVALHGLEPVRVAVTATAPMFAFLVAALSLAGLARTSGLVARAAEVLARLARGRALQLYLGVCLLTAALTLAVSLDGAVVLVAPVLLELHRRYRAPLAPLLLGAVAVANASSAAVPQGNPTNLVVIERLGLSPAGFVGHLFLPSLAAAAASALAIAAKERWRLSTPIRTSSAEREPLSRRELRALAALGSAAVAGFAAPLLGLAPWLPFAAVAAVALAVERPRAGLSVPWRVVVQVAALLAVLEPLAAHVPALHARTAFGLVALALGVSAVAALVNNLPASVAVATLPLASPGAFGAVIGLSVGALATPHGSVATLIALELADPDARIGSRLPLALAAACGLAAAAAVLVLTV